MTESATARYAMGYDDRERRRLQLQASIINPVTEQLLRRAGLGVGMRVLDVGSGVGDVAILAARIVGAQVQSPRATSTRRRSRSCGSARQAMGSPTSRHWPVTCTRSLCRTTSMP